MKIPPVSHSHPSNDPNLTVGEYIKGMENLKTQFTDYLELHPDDSKALADLQFVQDTLTKLKQLPNQKALVPLAIEQSVTKYFGYPIMFNF